MADHEQLVAEMGSVAKLSIQERLTLARTRRSDQLKCYEGQWKKVTAHAQKETTKRKGGRKAGGVRFDSRTRLFEAVSRNDIDEVRSLLKSGECQPNATNPDGFTILHQCCIDGHVDLIRSLIADFGSSVNQPDNELWTPLHTVALCARPQVTQLLIDHGANLLALNIDGNMPYDICDDEETLDIIELEMSKRGVTQEQIESLRMTREKEMLEDLQRKMTKETGDLERRGIRGETPLHVAAANGYTSVAKFLLDVGKVTVDAEDNDFWQPIHCAAKWRQLPVLELLIISGAKLTPTTGDGRTVFDLCDDSDIKSWMTELEDEVRAKKTSLAASHQRLLDIIASKSSLQMQTTGGGGQLYSSSTSLSASADGSKTSGLSSRLSISEKELMTRKEVLEESRMRLSLQSISNNDKPSSRQQQDNGQPSSSSRTPQAVNVSRLLEDGCQEDTVRRSRSLVWEDQNGGLSAMTTNPPLSNGGVGVRGHTMTTSINGHPKSCLKKTPSSQSQTTNGINNNNHADIPTNDRSTKSKIACCLIS